MTLAETEEYILDSLRNTYYSHLPCILKKSPAESLAYPFTLLTDSTDLTIATSDDDCLRFYSYNTGAGGTMTDYNSIVQWRDSDSSVHFGNLYLGEDDDAIGTDSALTIVEEDSVDKDDAIVNCASVLKVVQLETAEGVPATYLVETYMRRTSTVGCYNLMCVQIDRGLPKAMPLFVDSTGNMINAISFEINIPYWLFATKGRCWGWIDAYDYDNGILYVPRIDSRDNLSPTGRFSKYSWQDGHMVYIGEGAGIGLNPALADFKYFEGIYYSPEHSLRIDRMEDGRYRCAVWPRKSHQIDTPSMILYADAPASKDKYYRFEGTDSTLLIPVAEQHGNIREMQIQAGGRTVRTLPFE